MILRVGLLVVGLLLLVFLGWGAISSWVTVFTVGPDAPLSASGRGTGEGETTALVGAIVFTAFALLSAGAVLASAYVLRRRRA